MNIEMTLYMSSLDGCILPGYEDFGDNIHTYATHTPPCI